MKHLIEAQGDPEFALPMGHLERVDHVILCPVDMVVHHRFEQDQLSGQKGRRSERKKYRQGPGDVNADMQQTGRVPIGFSMLEDVGGLERKIRKHVLDREQDQQDQNCPNRIGHGYRSLKAFKRQKSASEDEITHPAGTTTRTVSGI